MNRNILALALIPLAAGCGGGGGGGPNPAPEATGFFDPDSTEESALIVVSLDTGGATLASAAGTLTRESDTLRLGGLTGGIDDTRTSVTLAGGGTVTITRGGTDYVAVYLAEPLGSAPTLGVLGALTEGSGWKTGGGAVYLGSTEIGLISSDAIYELSGGATVRIDFGDNTVAADFDGLGGTRTDGISALEQVDDVAEIALRGMALSGNTFSGGTAELSSDELPVGLSGMEAVEASGGVFGPDGDETGGVFRVDDTGEGEILFFGTFTAK